MTNAARLSYYAPLVLLPTVIRSAGRYRTRCGEVVTVEIASARHDSGCRGRYADGTPEGWHKSGRLYAGTVCRNDIVEEARPTITLPTS